MTLTPFPSTFYDHLYKDVITADRAIVDATIKHLAFVAKYCVGSVLDLGCGLGLLSNMINNQTYYGIDYSEFAIDWALEHCINPNASFLCGDLSTMLESRLKYDTVVISEILEHINTPKVLSTFAFSCAKKRVIGVLPVSMEMKGHVKGTWAVKEITALLGKNPLVLEQGCPTPKGRKIHWHFVYEVK